MELNRIREQLKQKDMGDTYTSGFSIGDSDLDRVKIQLKNIKDTFNGEKQKKDEVFTD